MYDYLILGGGMGGLAIAALLAESGNTVCVLERHHTPGGFAHTFTQDGYSFCHQVQYLVGCGERGAIRTFLQRLNLEDQVLFNSLDPDGFDRIQIGQLRFDVPTRIESYQQRLIEMFPDEAKAIQTYFDTARRVYEQSEMRDHSIESTELLLHPIRHRTILRYRNYTLRQFLDELGISPELRAILCGQIGNECLRTSELSLIVHLCMQASYCESAHFPKRGMSHFVGEVVKVLCDHGGVLRTNCRVERLEADDGRIVGVITNQGRFDARRVISDLDPHLTFDLIDPETEVPQRFRRRLDYRYSASAFSVYLGLKDLDLRQRGFTRSNIWHHSSPDVDKEIDSAMSSADYSTPFLFVSIPSLLSDESVLCPRGCQTMYIGTIASFDYFETLRQQDAVHYERKKKQIGDKLVDIVAQHYLPDLRDHIDVCIVHTPVDMHSLVHNPNGNNFGANLTPQNYGLQKLSFDTPFSNLWCVGSTAAFPGIMGVILGSMTLFDRLSKT